MGDEQPAYLSTHLSATASALAVSRTEWVNKLHRGRKRLVTKASRTLTIASVQLLPGVEAASEVTFRTATNKLCKSLRGEMRAVMSLILCLFT